MAMQMKLFEGLQYKMIAGVDEAGRGPLAGPVVAAAVILNPDKPIGGLNDSKLLTLKQREQLFEIIHRDALAVSVASASVEEIDAINILQASLLAMDRAVARLSLRPEHVLVDGNQLPKWSYSCEAIIGGDASVAAISAASIIAKVTRDREMTALDKLYPGYGFAKHVGYPTKAHFEALETLGVSAIHRKSFTPVANRLNRR